MKVFAFLLLGAATTAGSIGILKEFDEQLLSQRKATVDDASGGIMEWDSVNTRPGDTVVEDVSELIGALVRTPGSYYQILDAQFGISATGDLAFSSLTYLLPDNSVGEYDYSAAFSLSTPSVSDLHGFYISVGSKNQPPVWVEDFLIVVDRQGYYQVRFAQGIDAVSGEQVRFGARNTDGAVVPIFSAEDTCAWDTFTLCRQKEATCFECSPPPQCDCIVGSGCTLGTMILCVGECSTGDCDTKEIIVPPHQIPVQVCFCPEE